MDAIQSYRDLVVWQQSIALAGKVYAATRLLPSEERDALKRQLRNSAGSVASKVAAGAARRSRPEFLKFLHLARGSLAELETQMMIAIELKYLGSETELPTQIVAQIAEIGRLIDGQVRSLTAARQEAHARACNYKVVTTNKQMQASAPSTAAALPQRVTTHR